MSYLFDEQCEDDLVPLLQQVWKETTSFVDEDNATSESVKLLQWFPSMRPFRIMDLGSIVMSCIESVQNNESKLQYTIEFLNCMKVAAIILQLRGEVSLSLAAFRFLDQMLGRITHEGGECDDPLVAMHYILTKCSWAKLLCLCKMEKEALSVSEKALHLSDGFESCVSRCRERKDKIKKMKDHLMVESASVRIQALLLVRKLSEAEQLAQTITSIEFIDADHRKVSFASSFAAARVDILLSEISMASAQCTLGSFAKHHFLQQTVHALQTIVMLLDQCCPGMFQMLKVCDFSGPVKAVPKLGRRSVGSNNDMLRQFELFLDLFHILYKISDLWLTVGEVRVASLYISDGITLSRLLLLPERELQFELLMAKLARMECNYARLDEELAICEDIIKYIDCNNRATCDIRRTRLHSNNVDRGLASDDEDVTEALKNSSLMEEVGEDALTMPTVDLDISSTVSVSAPDLTASPPLPRRKPKPMPHRSNHHPDSCGCTLCTNCLLVKQQCLLAELRADYMKNVSASSPTVVKLLQSARRNISLFNNKQQMDKKGCGDQTGSGDGAELLWKELLDNTTALAEAYFSFGNLRSSTMFIKKSLRLMSVCPLSSSCSKVSAKIHLLAGKSLMDGIHRTTAADTSVYMDAVIDHLGRRNVSCAVDQNLAHKLNNLSIPTSRKKEDDSANRKASDSIPDRIYETPGRPKTSKKPTTKASGSALKTPQVKRTNRVTRANAKTPAGHSTSRTSKSKNFEIFNENNVPQISLSQSASKAKTSDSHLPLPGIDDSHNDDGDGDKALFAQPRRSNRTPAISATVDESVDRTQETDPCGSPAMKTRPRRKAATRNVRSSRREARRRHREEEGPVYTSEDRETVRPSRRPAKSLLKPKDSVGDKEDHADPDGFKDADEIESMRENTSFLLNTLPQPGRANQCFAELHDLEDFSSTDLSSCHAHLVDSFKLSTACGDFHTTKSSAQCIALQHAPSAFASQKDPWVAAAFHTMSIGITLRSVFHLSVKGKIKATQKVMKQNPNLHADACDPVLAEALQEMAEITHPYYFIKNAEKSKSYIQEICKELPAAWTVCLLSTARPDAGDATNHIIVTRLRRDFPPLHFNMDGSAVADAMSKFNHLMQCNVDGMKSTDKSLWWTQRRKMNRALGDFITGLGRKILNHYRGVMLGCVLSDAKRDEIIRGTEAIVQFLGNKDVDKQLVEMYLSSWNYLSTDEKVMAVCTILPPDSPVDTVLKVFESFETKSCSREENRGHVVLILDKDLQLLPWESIPLLNRHSVSRLPSIDTLRWLLRLSKSNAYVSVDFRNAAYVINPKGDLVKTENRFADWFKSIHPWQGLISEPPSQQQWFSFLSEKDIFIFCGHGSGSHFIQREVLARRRSRACALLMGCRSGKLTETGKTEPEGMAISYLLSGSPCVLGCLWPVTDKDIDMYFAKCFSTWMRPGTSLTDVVRASSSVCKMPHLNGAACVVYGIPAFCHETTPAWRDNMPGEFRSAL